MKFYFFIISFFHLSVVFSQIEKIESVYDYSYTEFRNGKYRSALKNISSVWKTVEADSNLINFKYNFGFLRAEIFENMEKIKKTYNSYNYLVRALQKDNLKNTTMYITALEKWSEYRPLHFNGKNKRDIGGWAFVSFNYGLRKLNFPEGRLGIELESLRGGSGLYEKKYGPIGFAHYLDFDLVGFYDNYEWYPFKSDFGANTHVFLILALIFYLLHQTK